MIAFLFTVIAVFALFAIIKAIEKHSDGDNTQSIPNAPSKSNKVRKIPKVQSYEKWEKKVKKKKGKNAITNSLYIFLSIEEAEKLMTHDQSKDDMRVLDLILDAKLDGLNHIKLEREVYERLNRF